MLPPRKATAALAAGTATALLAAGCHIGSQASGPLSPTQEVALAAGQARQASSFGAGLSVTMSGAVSETIAGTMQISTQPSLLAAGDFGTVDLAGRAVPGGLQEILTGQTVYLRMKALAQQLHKPWAEIQFSALRQGTGISLGQLTQQVQASSPLVQTQMLAAAKNVRVVGRQVIGGVRTTQYAGSYTAAAGVAALPPSLRATEARGMQALGIQVVSFNAWIDARHQARKIVVSENGSTEQVRVRLQITSINRGIDVSLPPPGQVAVVPPIAVGG
jgi:hypothetical protein